MSKSSLDFFDDKEEEGGYGMDHRQREIKDGGYVDIPKEDK